MRGLLPCLISRFCFAICLDGGRYQIVLRPALLHLLRQNVVSFSDPWFLEGEMLFGLA